MRLQHGSNPEQSRVFQERTPRSAELCDAGHAIVMEQWAAEVAEYAHRVEPE